MHPGVCSGNFAVFVTFWDASTETTSTSCESTPNISQQPGRLISLHERKKFGCIQQHKDAKTSWGMYTELFCTLVAIALVSYCSVYLWPCVSTVTSVWPLIVVIDLLHNKLSIPLFPLVPLVQPVNVCQQ